MEDGEGRKAGPGDFWPNVSWRFVSLGSKVNISPVTTVTNLQVICLVNAK